MFWRNGFALSADDPDAALAAEAVRKPRATRVQQDVTHRSALQEAAVGGSAAPRGRLLGQRHGTTTSGVYRSIFGYDPVAQWRGT